MTSRGLPPALDEFELGDRASTRPEDLLDGSNARLTEIAAAVDGPGADLRPKALGLLGLNHHRLGNHARAVDYTRAAHDESRSQGDDQSVRVYTLNADYLQSAASAGVRP